MSQKWKFKIKTGLIWGVFMAVAMTAMDAFEKSSFGVYLSWKFVAQLAVFSFCGIFILGHFNWKAREKASANKSQ